MTVRTVTEVDVVLDVRAACGECPGWWAERSLLTWVDPPRGEVHLFDPATGHDRRVTLDRDVGAVAQRSSGGLVAAVADGFAFVDPDLGTVTPIATIVQDPPGRMNDGQCDPAGRFWAGTLAHGMVDGAGSLYRLDPDSTVTRVLDGVTCSNGMGWSADGTTMYFVDSLRYAVDVFTVTPDGALADRRTLVAVGGEAEGGAGPDGLAVDAEGCLWVAVWGAGEVRRYTPTGRLDAVVQVPAPYVTSCAFGGPALDVLYLTSAAVPMGEGGPHLPAPSGALFACRPGATGLPARTFAG
jgi:sugar lactone lactonase YvrE